MLFYRVQSTAKDSLFIGYKIGVKRLFRILLEKHGTSIGLRQFRREREITILYSHLTLDNLLLWLQNDILDAERIAVCAVNLSYQFKVVLGNCG